VTIDLAFFGLRQAPFNPSPDPRLLYLAPAYAEALAQLLHGVRGRKGFMLLTGEVGTGKTTLLHALLKQLDARAAVAFVTNSLLSFESLLEYILEDFGVPSPGDTHARRLFALQHFLTERWRAGENAVLILDEAQDFDARTLEQIRLLSNFEADHEKILQIVLVGQPELRAKLDLPELRQLKQRIGLRCEIPPLAQTDVGAYIRTRLRLAGSPYRNLFIEEAVVRIARYSGGVPRLVNTVCDHCLLFAYADRVKRVDRAIVEQVVDYLETGPARRRRRRLRAAAAWSKMSPLRWSILGASTATAAGLASIAALRPVATRQTLDLVASSITDFARTARALFSL
jgi:general secretion pathway protein A